MNWKSDHSLLLLLMEVFFCFTSFYSVIIECQLLVSSFFLWRECKSSTRPRMTTEWRSVCLFPIPSIIYLVHNNVQFATLTYVDTSTYQIMGNLKIVTTGILFRCFYDFEIASHMLHLLLTVFVMT